MVVETAVVLRVEVLSGVDGASELRVNAGAARGATEMFLMVEERAGRAEVARDAIRNDRWNMIVTFVCFRHEKWRNVRFGVWGGLRGVR